MLWEIIIFVLLIVLSSSSGGMFYRRKRNGNRSNNYSVNSDAIKKVLKLNSLFIDEFIRQEDKTVLLEWLNIRETFNHFPFDSDFKNIRQVLKDDELVRYIDSSSVKYNDVFKVYQENLLNQLVSGEYDITIQQCADALNEFCNQSYVHYRKYFINSFLRHVAIIGQTQHKINIQKVSDIFDAYENIITQTLYKILDEIANSNFYHNSNNYVEQNDEELELKNAFSALNIKDTASNDEIKKSYRQLAKKYHPDKNTTEQAKQKMSEINVAYEIIKKKRGF